MLTLIKKKKKSGMMRKKTAQNQTNIGETTLTFDSGNHGFDDYWTDGRTYGRTLFVVEDM